MALFLQTETNPGAAEWGPAPSGGSESLALIISISAGGPAPVVDPDGRRNLCYILTQEINESIDVTLPEITPTLPPTWRISWGGDLTGASGSISVIPGGTDEFANSPNNATLYVLGNNGESAFFDSITLVHDGVSQWALF
jgi:hypothetical protein